MSAEASPEQTFERTSWSSELADTWRLAWPMMLTQLGQIAMLTTDLAMLGRLGDEVLAAASLAHAVLFAAFVLGIGLMWAVAPLGAQAVGRGDEHGPGQALRAGLVSAVLLGVPVSLASEASEALLLLLGQTAEVSRVAGDYLETLSWSLAPAWMFMALRSFMAAVGRPSPGLWITLAAVPLNAALAWGLIFGTAGLPQLGIAGAGIATTVVALGMCAAAAWIAARAEPFVRYRPFSPGGFSDLAMLGRLMSNGLPVSAAYVLEHGLFMGSTLLIGMIGTQALAASQIALQVANIAFMVPFGISLAAGVRVGHAFGRRDRAGMRRAGVAALALAGGVATANALLVVLARMQIPPLFTGAGADPATLELASLLLLAGASFFVFDALQTVAGGILRGMSDTRMPLAFAALSYWLIGFPLAAGLAFPAGFGVLGIWTGWLVGLATFSGLLVWRFRALCAPLSGPLA